MNLDIASEHYFTAAEGKAGAYRANGDVHVGSADTPLVLGLLTFCVLVLRDGTVTVGEALSDHLPYDVEAARAAARRSATKKRELRESFRSYVLGSPGSPA